MIYLNSGILQSLSPIFKDTLRNSTGATFSSDPKECVTSLSISGTHTTNMANDPIYLEIAPISVEIEHILCNHVNISQSGLPVLPAIAPTKESDLWEFDNVPLFTKRTVTRIKEPSGHNGLAYCKWENPEHLLQNLPPDFWVSQTALNSNKVYSITPYIQDPKSLDLLISINPDGESLVWDVIYSEYESSNKPGRAYTYDRHDSSDIENRILQIASSLGLRGIHSVQLCPYKGNWVVQDWNPRLYQGMHWVAKDKLPTLVKPLAHIAGKSIPDVPPIYFLQQRFEHCLFPRGAHNLIDALGLFRRFENRNKLDLITRLFAAGYSKEEALYFMTLFERFVL